MAKQKKQRAGAPDPHTLDFSQASHREYWTRRWGVSVHQLRSAVHNTRSTTVKVIEAYLRERGAI